MCPRIPDKNWIDMLSALLTPTIAISSIVIGCLQWWINQKRLQNELFTRRIDLYEKIASYIANILTLGNLREGVDAQFLRDTKHTTFIFGEDIKRFVDDIYDKSCSLNLLRASGSLQDENLSKQKEILSWFSNELNNMQDRFIKYLKL